MDFEDTFGDTIKKLRNERNLTLREVSEALDMDISMLGKIEKNTRKPTVQFIKKLSKLFNVNDKDLKIAFLSDSVVYKVADDEELAQKVLKIAEKKVKYLTTRKKA